MSEKIKFSWIKIVHPVLLGCYPESEEVLAAAFDEACKRSYFWNCQCIVEYKGVATMVIPESVPWHALQKFLKAYG